MMLFADNNPWQVVVIAAAFLVIIVAIFFLAVISRYLRLWVQSVFSGFGIGIFDLVAMTFRQSRSPRDRAQQDHGRADRGLGDETGITTRAMDKAHYMAGGKVPLVIRAIIAANKAKIINLDWKLATQIDLAGRDVLEAVQTSVYPKVIDCPARGSVKDSLEAVAKNGIQLKVKARVTVRANLNQLVGGATEQTIIARVGQGIVAAIGSADKHSDVPGQPRSHLEEAVLSPGDWIRKLRLKSSRSATSPTWTWAITSAPACRPHQAEAVMRVASAPMPKAAGPTPSPANKRSVAQIEESRLAKLVAAEAEVPKAISSAIRTGTLRDHGLLQAQKRASRHRYAPRYRLRRGRGC